MEHYLVAGGGLAGLTAANALAGAGRKVTLIEQSKHLGGRAITQDNRGYFFNLGPHALYKGGAACRTFLEWGVPFQGHPPDTSSASFFVYRGRKYPLITGLGNLLTTRLFSLGEKFEVARILHQLETAQPSPGESMETWTGQRVQSPRVRQFVAMLVRVSSYCADLSNLSARAAIAQFRSAAKPGVLYLDGGWRTLVTGLENRARALGVEIRLGEPLENLRNLQAEGVVLAVPPAAVERITGRRLRGMHPARAACLDLGLRKLPAGSARVAFALDEPLYLSVHSAVARLAPPGAALVHLCKYLSGPGDPAADRLQLEQFADHLMPGWREHVEASHFLPNMTVTPAVPSPQGRPAVDELGEDGVFLAGDWVGDEAMLTDTAVSSALLASSLVQRRKQRAA